MNFDELCKLVEEAKGTKPGERYHNARTSEPYKSKDIGSKVSGVAASPIGKSDNFEERVPIDQKNKKGFDPKAASKQANAKIDVEGDLRKKTSAEKGNVFGDIARRGASLTNAFALLNNDPHFRDEMQKMMEGMSDMLSIPEKAERRLDTLRFMETELAGKETSQRETVDRYNSLMRDISVPDEEKEKAKIELKNKIAAWRPMLNNLRLVKGGNGGKAKDSIKLLDKLLSRKNSLLKSPHQTPKTMVEIGKVNDLIKKTRTDIQNLVSKNPKIQDYVDQIMMLMDEIDDLSLRVDKMTTNVPDIEEKYTKAVDSLTKTTDSLAEVREELTSLENTVNRVTAYNTKKNEERIAKFEQLVTNTAGRILDETFDNPEPEDPSQEVDWGETSPDRENVKKMLIGLSSNDPTVNPISKLIKDLYAEYNSESPEGDLAMGILNHDPEKNSNKNENITIMREYERLPFFIVTKLYNKAKLATMPIGAAIQSEKFQKAYKWFFNLCNSKRKETDEDGKMAWNNAKLNLKKILGIYDNDAQISYNGPSLGDALPEHRKVSIENLIDEPYTQIRGSNNFGRLLNIVDSYIRDEYPRAFAKIKDTIIKGSKQKKVETIKESKSFDDMANEYAESLISVDMNDFYIDLLEVKSLLDKKRK